MKWKFGNTLVIAACSLVMISSITVDGHAQSLLHPPFQSVSTLPSLGIEPPANNQGPSCVDRFNQCTINGLDGYTSCIFPQFTFSFDHAKCLYNILRPRPTYLGQPFKEPADPQAVLKDQQAVAASLAEEYQRLQNLVDSGEIWNELFKCFAANDITDLPGYNFSTAPGGTVEQCEAGLQSWIGMCRGAYLTCTNGARPGGCGPGGCSPFPSLPF